MSERVRTIALTIGDSNGIGPEIAVKAAEGPIGANVPARVAAGRPDAA